MKIRFSNDNKVFNMHTEEIPYLSFDIFDRMGVPNLFSTRFVSYNKEKGLGEEGLRLTVMRTDDIDEAAPLTIANRDRLARQIGSSIEFECVTSQKHTNYVHVACREELGPRWPDQMPLHRDYVDGIVTDIPDALITVFGGDCPPVYLADPVRKAVGLVHAGWRGTLGRIPEVAIAQMVVKFGCDPADIYAAIGPGVCKDCYEMGDEVYEAFASEWSGRDADMILSRYPAVDENGREIPGGKYHLDLREANKMTLMRAGIPEDHIAISNICTKCNADTFYSHRAHRLENENAAMIVNRFR